jgi:uncharacterized hydrophobic protein (TIGR00271 family)
MLQLRLFTPPERSGEIQERLLGSGAVRHILVGGETVNGMILLTAEVDSRAADDVLAMLRDSNLDPRDVVLWRASSIQPLMPHQRFGGHIDAAVRVEVLGRALESARPAVAYLLYMLAAGVIAGVGVITASSILIVGAMAISPDLLPISATAVALVEGQVTLALRATATLWAGLFVTMLGALLTTTILRISDRVPADLILNQTALGTSITELGPGTVLVALAAGMAGMLAYETVGSAAVGVAISVTTIPAAAYIGDALAFNGNDDAWGAVDVLLVNVFCILLASTLTLWLQRRFRPEPK